MSPLIVSPCQVTMRARAWEREPSLPGLFCIVYSDGFGLLFHVKTGSQAIIKMYHKILKALSPPRVIDLSSFTTSDSNFHNPGPKSIKFKYS